MANEVRLINANALLDYLRKEKAEFEQYGYVDQAVAEGIGESIAEVEKAPTVDAVEVVHGRWEDEYGGKFENPRYRCSVCKEKALYRNERDCLGSWHEVQALTDYCPNCGADMRERKDNV